MITTCEASNEVGRSSDRPTFFHFATRTIARSLAGCMDLDALPAKVRMSGLDVGPKKNPGAPVRMAQPPIGFEASIMGLQGETSGVFNYTVNRFGEPSGKPNDGR